MQQSGHPLQKTVLFVSSLLFVVMSFLKGWLTFVLVPALLVVIPLYLVLEFMALRRYNDRADKDFRSLGYGLTLTLILFYLFIPGVDDVREYIIGFIPVDPNGLVAIMADVIALGSALVAFILCIGILFLTIKRKR